MIEEKHQVVFGSGSVGVPGSSQWPVKRGIRYTCFDPLFKKHPPEVANPQVEFQNKSAADTGLPDQSVDTLHMHNLLSDNPETHRQREAILREAARILKRDGKLYSLNDQVSIRVKPEDFKKWGEKFGLETHVHFENTDPEGTLPRRLTDAEKEAFLRVLKGTAHEYRADLRFALKASLVEMTKK